MFLKKRKKNIGQTLCKTSLISDIQTQKLPKLQFLRLLIYMFYVFAGKPLKWRAGLEKQ